MPALLLDPHDANVKPSKRIGNKIVFFIILLIYTFLSLLYMPFQKYINYGQVNKKETQYVSLIILLDVC